MPHLPMKQSRATQAPIVLMAPQLLLFSDSFVDRLGYAALIHDNPQAQQVIRDDVAEHLNQVLFLAFCRALPPDRLGRFVQLAADRAPIAVRRAYLREYIANLEQVVISVILQVQREHLATSGMAV